MSTRSHIGFEHCTDRSVSYVYCHFDGYLQHNGVLLQLFHAAPDRALMLVAGGAMQGLGRDCSWLPLEAFGGSLPDVPHTDRYPPEDDGSDGPMYADSIEAMSLEEYNYVFSEKHGIWFVNCYETKGVWAPLEPTLARNVRDWESMTRAFTNLVEEAAR